ncbi:MAG: RecQ family ATP-dependent DNA helicase [Acidimicrobiales bacterium]
MTSGGTTDIQADLPGLQADLPDLQADLPDLRARADELLRQLTGDPDAALRPSQLEAITTLASDRRRALLVQRTGWGKSAVYFITTRLLRDAGAGPTLLVSPLLALMRNQIEAAARMGLRAATLNSSNTDEWAEVRAAIDADEIDVLLVSPERFANAGFRAEVLPVVSPRSGLLVVDEAHCISDWGHDFRPDYRRIVRILELLPSGVPVLCCTATAHDRVVADIEHQLGDDLVVLRGPLARDGLSLHVLDLPAQAQRLAWLADTIPTLPGTGIVYCLTVRDTASVTSWLRANGIDAVAYSGGDDDDHRQGVEQRLLANEVKVVVATSALGMGFDKPDLAFVIHYQAPGSSIAYYQQVGRAGRRLDRSIGVLLRGAEDADIQDWFINMAFPPPDVTDRVLG